MSDENPKSPPDAPPNYVGIVTIDTDVIDHLIDTVMETLQEDTIATTTANPLELASAVLTVALRVCKASLARGADPQAILNGVRALMMSCNAPTDRVH